MKILVVFFIAVISFLSACSPIKQRITSQYTMDNYGSIAGRQTSLSIFVSKPEAMPGYQTNQMLYRKKPFELNSFSSNSWVGPPADMLYPLIVQSLQSSRFFKAVASGPYTEHADYHIDTQLFALEQNFIINPSQLNFKVKAVLSSNREDKVIASRIFKYTINCPMNSPYGGVLAANKATLQFTKDLTRFIISKVKNS